jgi:hypothetical protein
MFIIIIIIIIKITRLQKEIIHVAAETGWMKLWYWLCTRTNGKIQQQTMKNRIWGGGGSCHPAQLELNE